MVWCISFCSSCVQKTKYKLRSYTKSCVIKGYTIDAEAVYWVSVKCLEWTLNVFTL
jgi:hypothetical protein